MTTNQREREAATTTTAAPTDDAPPRSIRGCSGEGSNCIRERMAAVGMTQEELSRRVRETVWRELKDLAWKFDRQAEGVDNRTQDAGVPRLSQVIVLEEVARAMECLAEDFRHAPYCQAV